MTGICDGRVVIVTGGARGIGRGHATLFAREGARVVVNDWGAEVDGTGGSSGPAGEVVDEIRAGGGEAIANGEDVADWQGAQRLVEAALDNYGQLDVVVNNAGGSMPRPFPETREQEFEEGLRWNVTSAFNLSQLALPHLVASGAGSIINIASSAGRNPARGFAGYGTAKAALIQFTRNLALEVAPRVRVNAIAPGSIGTTALDTVLTNETLKRQMIELTPLRRIGREEDIAAGAVYLASDAASYVTGRVLDIDGGIRHSNLDMGIPDLG